MEFATSFDLEDLSTVDDEEILDRDLQIFKAIKSFDLMSYAAAPTEAVCVKALMVRHKLQHFLSVFEEFNGSATAPYHNNYHSFTVVLNCYEGAYHEKLTESQTRALLVAALFHDFNHSAGAQSDEINIKKACAGVRAAQVLAATMGLQLTQIEYELAISAIEVTKYPYERLPSNPLEKIIRDADLMQPYEGDASILLHQHIGLASELERAGVINVTTLAAYAERTKQFLNEISWFTPWAQKKSEVVGWEVKKQRLLALLSGNHERHDR